MRKTILNLGAIAFALFANSAYSATDQELSDSIAKKLQQPIKTHFGAFNFDIMDFPQDEGGPLSLEKVREKGSIININEDHKNQIVILIAVNPEDRRHGEHWQLKNEGTSNHAIDDLRKFCKEYSDKGIAIYAVWLPKNAKNRSQNLENALAYAEKTNFPCPLTLETAGFKKKKGGKLKTAFTQYIGLHAPGHTFPTISCIKDKNNKIVRRGYDAYTGFSYHTTKHIIDRLLDPEYEKAVRMEFAETKSRVLPITEKKDGGVLLKDDFEGYKNSHNFKLQPRWGFSYERQSRLDLKGSLLKAEGRNGSTSAEVTIESNCLNMYTYPLQHKLPEPLKNGYIKFYLKRHPKASSAPPRKKTHPSESVSRSFCATFGQPGTYYSAGHLFATGEWNKETFVTNFRNDQPGKVAYSAKNWHEIIVECNPGQKATIKIDGQKVGELKSEEIDWVGVRINAGNTNRSFLIDDFEVFYKDKKSVSADYAKDYKPAATFTAEEQAWIHKKHMIEYAGKEQIELAEGAIKRGDFNSDYGGQATLTFDKPLILTDIILEDMRNKGEMVNVLEKYKGKVIWFAPLIKGDHGLEKTMRPRTTRRSVTVFNRVYKLAMEYRKKGVIVIGLGCYDGGHRSTSTSSEDKKRAFMEAINSSEDLAEEANIPRDQVVYGVFDEAFDEILWESHTNKLRLWNKTIMGTLERGSFAGKGADVIINQKGQCVYRGSGPDGFGYWKQRYVLDRLLDSDFENAVRQDLRNPQLKHYRSPLLPVQEKRADGLAYKDGFESYKSTYEYGLNPCWGFSYTTFPDEERAGVFNDKGKNNSAAILVNRYYPRDMFCGNKAIGLNGRHFFPTALKEGHFSMYIKRGPVVKYPLSDALYRLGIVVYGKNGRLIERLTTSYNHLDWKKKYGSLNVESETLTTIGPMEKESFHLVETKTFMQWNTYKKTIIKNGIIKDLKTSMAKDAWQEVKFICKQGEKVKVLIDNKKIGSLKFENITGIEFRGETSTGVYVDDVELLYKGNADEIKAQNEQAVKDDFTKRQEEWKKEVLTEK